MEHVQVLVSLKENGATEAVKREEEEKQLQHCIGELTEQMAAHTTRTQTTKLQQ